MELRRLRNFLRIASEGSLGKASRAIGIAQPALGRQVQLLESELGVKLFERASKGMVLTDEGEYLKEALEHPVQQVDLALNNVRSYSTRVEASLVLGLPPVLAEAFGGRLIARLRREMPNLKLHVVERGSIELARDIARGLVDIALIIDVPPDSRAFHSEILTERLMLVGPTGSIAARFPDPSHCLPFSQLEGLPMVLPGPNSTLRTKLTKAAAGVNATIHVPLEVESLTMAKQAILTGGGFSIMTPLAFSAEEARGELAGRTIAGLEQSLLWAVQPRWRVPRSIYNEVEHSIYQELYLAVDQGEWAATWTLDLDRLSLPLFT